MEIEDELRSEYDLHSLRVRKLGSGRKSFGTVNKCISVGARRLKLKRNLL